MTVKADPAFRGGNLTDAGWMSTVGAWVLAIAWILPLVYALWAAFHPPQFATTFSLTAPLTLENFVAAWHAAPFPQYFLNTIILVAGILVIQLVLCTLAAYAFARYEFVGSNILFSLMLVQLMVMPEILIVRNYQTLSSLGLVDTLFGIGLPYFASAFAIFFAATNLQDSAQGAGGGCANGRGIYHADSSPCLYPIG